MPDQVGSCRTRQALMAPVACPKGKRGPGCAGLIAENFPDAAPRRAAPRYHEARDSGPSRGRPPGSPPPAARHSAARKP